MYPKKTFHNHRSAPRSSPSRPNTIGNNQRRRSYHQQMLDKYITLARNALSNGDRIDAELNFQYADHYFRLLNLDEEQPRPPSDVREPTEEVFPLPLTSSYGGASQENEIHEDMSSS